MGACRDKIVKCIDPEKPITEVGDFDKVRFKLRDNFGSEKNKDKCCRPKRDAVKVFEVFTEGKNGFEKIWMAHAMYRTLFGWDEELGLEIWDETVKDEYKTALKEYVESEKDIMEKLSNFMNLRNSIRHGTEMQEAVEDEGLKIFSDVGKMIEKESGKAKTEKLKDFLSYIRNSFDPQRQVHLIDKFQILELLTKGENSHEKIETAFYMFLNSLYKIDRAFFENINSPPRFSIEALESNMTISEKKDFAILLDYDFIPPWFNNMSQAEAADLKRKTEEYYKLYEKFAKARMEKYKPLKDKVDKIIKSEYKNAFKECKESGGEGACTYIWSTQIKEFYPELQTEIEQFLQEIKQIERQKDQEKKINLKPEGKIQPNNKTRLPDNKTLREIFRKRNKAYLV